MDIRGNVFKTIEKHNMFSPLEKVVVGVSGGADSLTLLFILHDLQVRLGQFLLPIVQSVTEAIVWAIDNFGKLTSAVTENNTVNELATELWGLLTDGFKVLQKTIQIVWPLIESTVIAGIKIISGVLMVLFLYLYSTVCFPEGIFTPLNEGDIIWLISFFPSIYTFHLGLYVVLNIKKQLSFADISAEK